MTTELHQRIPIESAVGQEHMSDMPKYHQRVTVWGGNVPTEQVSVSLDASQGSASCAHVVDTVRVTGALMRGAESFSFFPSMHEVRVRIEPDGLRADWQRVGADMKSALAMWSTQSMAKRERA